MLRDMSIATLKFFERRKEMYQKRKLRPKEKKVLQEIRRERGRFLTNYGSFGEEIAAEICNELKTQGTIQEYHLVVRHSFLDRGGVDLIVWTEKGIYLLNVKSSFRAARIFQNSVRKPRYRIYPWTVKLTEPKEIAKMRFMKEIHPLPPSLPPSCDETFPQAIEEYFKKTRNKKESAQEQNCSSGNYQE
jgi:hypothetical protein